MYRTLQPPGTWLKRETSSVEPALTPARESNMTGTMLWAIAEPAGLLMSVIKKRCYIDYQMRELKRLNLDALANVHVDARISG